MIAGEGKKSRVVYCSRCTHLLLVRGERVMALCTATARFRGGAVLPKVDLFGVVAATSRNAGNSCAFYRRVWSFKSWKAQKWVLERLKSDRARLCEFSINDEVREEFHGGEEVLEEEEEVEAIDIEVGVTDTIRDDEELQVLGELGVGDSGEGRSGEDVYIIERDGD